MIPRATTESRPGETSRYVSFEPIEKNYSMMASLSFVTSCEEIRERWDRNVVCRLDEVGYTIVGKLNSEFLGVIFVKK